MRIVWPRFLLAFVVGAALMAFFAGVPTDVIPNDFFTRMTPVRGYDVPVLVTVSLLSGALAATWWGVAGPACPMRRPGATGAAGATLGWLAIGCPVCNKIVVFALGVSGAVNLFGPAQPWMAALSVVLLVAALAWRVRALLGTGRASPQLSDA